MLFEIGGAINNICFVSLHIKNLLYLELDTAFNKTFKLEVSFINKTVVAN